MSPQNHVGLPLITISGKFVTPNYFPLPKNVSDYLSL